MFNRTVGGWDVAALTDAEDEEEIDVAKNLEVITVGKSKEKSELKDESSTKK